RSDIFKFVVGPHPHDLCLRRRRGSALLPTTVRLVPLLVVGPNFIHRAGAPPPALLLGVYAPRNGSRLPQPVPSPPARLGFVTNDCPLSAASCRGAQLHSSRRGPTPGAVARRLRTSQRPNAATTCAFAARARRLWYPPPSA